MRETLHEANESDIHRRGVTSPHPLAKIWICFTSDTQVAEMEPMIRAYLAEAMGYAEKGIKAEKVVREVEMPEELTDALDNDPELAEAFDALTPGRQRSYAYALNTAKNSETRVRRIEKFRDHIIAGKGALER